MSHYKAGAASICITPDESLWLAGYAVRTAPARGKLSDLYARALALEDGTGQRFVIVSMDMIAVTSTVATRVADAVCMRHGLSRQQLLFAATHTHYAPEYRPEKALFFNIPADYAAKFPAVAEKLVAALTQVIEQSLAKLEPVRLFARRASAGFAHNRRRRGVKEGTPSPEDVLDHDVPVLDCVDASGHHQAIVFGYACHNLTIPPDDLRYCADWAGFACERLQQANPRATALFIAGAGADQDPEPRGSVELSQQYGQEIANAVEQSLQAPGVEITGPIRIAWDELTLPLEPVSNEQLSIMLHSDDPPKGVKARFLLDAIARGEPPAESCPVPLQVVRFGNELLMVALSGEPVVDWAHKLKREVSARKGTRNEERGTRQLPNRVPLIWVVGYCNDMFGYLPTRRVQTEGGYEAGRATLWSEVPAPFTADVEDRVTTAVLRLVEQVEG